MVGPVWGREGGLRDRWWIPFEGPEWLSACGARQGRRNGAWIGL